MGDLVHGRAPFRSVVSEGHAEFGELTFQLLHVGVEGRVDPCIDVAVEGGGECEKPGGSVVEPLRGRIRREQG